ncbi:MAG TPA: hypothetical protein VM925_27670, partial [Labilithrix sp.]|nr:hypothetical protein [Labilithrix sp.]
MAYGAGTLYVLDATSVRAMHLASGTVSTIVGSLTEEGDIDGIGSDARLSAIGGGALVFEEGKEGNVLYLVEGGHKDSDDHPWGGGNGKAWGAVVRQIDLTTHHLVTLAGSPGVYGSAGGEGTAARFTNPTGLAVIQGPEHQHMVMVADEGASDLSTIETVLSPNPPHSPIPFVKRVPPTSYLHRPRALGSVGYEDYNAFVLADGGIYRGSGTPLEGSSNVRAFTLTKDRLYAGTIDGTIREWWDRQGSSAAIAGANKLTGTVDGTGSDARFRGPRAVVEDGKGTFFVADGGRIREIDSTTRAVRTLSVSPSFDAQALAFDGTRLYAASTRVLYAIDPQTGHATPLAGSETFDVVAGPIDGTGANANFVSIMALVADGHGRLFVHDNFAIRQVELATANVTTRRAGVT